MHAFCLESRPKLAFPREQARRESCKSHLGAGSTVSVSQDKHGCGLDTSIGMAEGEESISPESEKFGDGS